MESSGQRAFDEWHRKVHPLHQRSNTGVFKSCRWEVVKTSIGKESVNGIVRKTTDIAPIDRKSPSENAGEYICMDSLEV
jgi:hypothetical protein